MRFPAICSATGQLIYISTPSFIGTQSDIMSLCPELEPYRPILEPQLPSAVVLTGQRHEIVSYYRGPDPTMFEGRGINYGLPGGPHHVANPDGCCCNHQRRYVKPLSHIADFASQACQGLSRTSNIGCSSMACLGPGRPGPIFVAGLSCL